MARDPLTPHRLHATLRDAGRKGGRISADRKRQRRAKYEAGLMTGDELATYEAWRARNREHGRKGGWPSHRANKEDDSDGEGK